jgi:DNA-binding GntR family transcriptional regulator
VPAREAAVSPARARFARLHAELRTRICLLDYPPGVLLSEERLAGEFGVSRTPIRRALVRLEADGLVETQHGIGTVVTDLDVDTLTQIYAFRMRLAELIGEFETIPRTEADLDRIRLIERGLSDLLRAPDGREFARLNMLFAEELMAIIGNGAFRDISLKLYFQTSRLVVQRLPELAIVEEIRAFHGEVTDILAAIQRGDMRAVGFIRRNCIAMSFHRLCPSRGTDRRDP